MMRINLKCSNILLTDTLGSSSQGYGWGGIALDFPSQKQDNG